MTTVVQHTHTHTNTNTQTRIIVTGGDGVGKALYSRGVCKCVCGCGFYVCSSLFLSRTIILLLPRKICLFFVRLGNISKYFRELWTNNCTT